MVENGTKILLLDNDQVAYVQEPLSTQFTARYEDVRQDKEFDVFLFYKDRGLTWEYAE